ncbi:hypothetical protein KSC_060890 [Ktedonobacter sp. SOSP1-52]|uniref:hypothetical protein n=1 Tax=Ktedonobacter sp. SOSP1-52 TaxID=2778366 RepID=UPI001916AC17|nr:hypothetical protein [Ktedonobacter sp. SOSP1-52]GHO67197.1 hypothetical protein KSC_060890 [Ktedonobacter sp. SOSP1-52]
MRYAVTYRLTHPAYFPTTSMAQIEAHTHAELERKLAKIVSRWKGLGYKIRVTGVRQEERTLE